MDEKLSNGTCSKELSGGMSPSLEEYRELLKYDIEELAQDMVDEDNPYIDSIIEILKNISLGSSVGANGAKTEYTPKNYPKVDADTTNLGTLMENSLKEDLEIPKQATTVASSIFGISPGMRKHFMESFIRCFLRKATGAKEKLQKRS